VKITGKFPLEYISNSEFKACYQENRSLSMRNLEPKIFRKRLIVEGFYDVNIDEKFVSDLLTGLSKRLGMKIIAGPLIFSPNKVSEMHHGIGGFIAWTSSGVSFYTWDQHKFFTLDIYSCVPFNTGEVVNFVRDKLKCREFVYQEIRYENSGE